MGFPAPIIAFSAITAVKSAASDYSVFAFNTWARLFLITIYKSMTVQGSDHAANWALQQFYAFSELIEVLFVINVSCAFGHSA
jgi:hypothetical protein